MGGLLEAALKRSNWWQVGRLVDGSKWRVLAIAGLSFSSGGAEAAFLVVLTRVGLAVADGSERAGVFNGWRLGVPAALLLAAALLAVRLICSVAAAVLTTSLGSLVTARYRTRLANAFLSAPWPVQQSEPSGRLQHLVGGVAGVGASAVVSLGNSISALLGLAAMMFLAILVDPRGTVLVLLTLVLLGALLAPIRRRIKIRSRASAVASMEFGSLIAEISQMGLEVKAFGSGEKVAKVIHRSMERDLLARRRAGVLAAALPNLYLSLAFAALLVGVALASAVGVDELSSVGAVLLLMLRSLSYGQQLQSASGGLAGAVPYLEQIGDALGSYSKHPNSQRSVRPVSVVPIEFDQVTYTYDAVKIAVDRIDLRIERGEVLGVIGPSGAGKSTLVQLMLGLRSPSAGSVRAGGVDVSTIASDVWHKLVSFVPQEPNLLSGTVAENIRFFRDEISLDAIEQAAELAGLLNDIRDLPEGFDTFLGERGARLSGGQRQRLSIARALAGRPEVLVLDEPTSALDAQSEGIIRDTLRGLKGTVTVVVIAHRMSTLEMCDRLVVIESGAVSASGKPSDLQAKSEFYRRAVSAVD